MAHFYTLDPVAGAERMSFSGTSELCHTWQEKLIGGVSLVSGYNGRFVALDCKNRLLHEVLDARRDCLVDCVKTGFKNMQDRLKLISSKYWPLRNTKYHLSGCSAVVVLFRETECVVGNIGDNVVCLFSTDANGAVTEKRVLSKWHHLNNADERLHFETESMPLLKNSKTINVQWEEEENARRVIYLTRHLKKNGRFKLPLTCLTRGLGNLWSAVEGSDKQVVSTEPDVTSVELTGVNEQYIVIATRNVYDLIANENVIEELLQCNRERAYGNSAHLLVLAALIKANGRDFGTMSVVVIPVSDFWSQRGQQQLPAIKTDEEWPVFDGIMNERVLDSWRWRQGNSGVEGAPRYMKESDYRQHLEYNLGLSAVIDHLRMMQMALVSRANNFLAIEAAPAEEESNDVSMHTSESVECEAEVKLAANVDENPVSIEVPEAENAPQFAMQATQTEFAENLTEQCSQTEITPVYCQRTQTDNIDVVKRDQSTSMEPVALSGKRTQTHSQTQNQTVQTDITLIKRVKSVCQSVLAKQQLVPVSTQTSPSSSPLHDCDRKGVSEDDDDDDAEHAIVKMEALSNDNRPISKEAEHDSDESEEDDEVTFLGMINYSQYSTESSILYDDEEENRSDEDEDDDNDMSPEDSEPSLDNDAPSSNDDVPSQEGDFPSPEDDDPSPEDDVPANSSDICEEKEQDEENSEPDSVVTPILSVVQKSEVRFDANENDKSISDVESTISPGETCRATEQLEKIMNGEEIVIMKELAGDIVNSTNLSKRPREEKDSSDSETDSESSEDFFSEEEMHVSKRLRKEDKENENVEPDFGNTFQRSFDKDRRMGLGFGSGGRDARVKAKPTKPSRPLNNSNIIRIRLPNLEQKKVYVTDMKMKMKESLSTDLSFLTPDFLSDALKLKPTESFQPEILPTTVEENSSEMEAVSIQEDNQVDGSKKIEKGPPKIEVAGMSENEETFPLPSPPLMSLLPSPSFMATNDGPLKEDLVDYSKLCTQQPQVFISPPTPINEQVKMLQSSILSEFEAAKIGDQDVMKPSISMMSALPKVQETLLCDSILNNEVFHENLTDAYLLAKLKSPSAGASPKDNYGETGKF